MRTEVGTAVGEMLGVGVVGEAVVSVVVEGEGTTMDLGTMVLGTTDLSTTDLSTTDLSTMDLRLMYLKMEDTIEMEDTIDKRLHKAVVPFLLICLIHWV